MPKMLIVLPNRWMNLCFFLWTSFLPLELWPLVKHLLKKKSRTNASGNVARACKELSKRVSEFIAESRMNWGRAETTGIMQWWRRVDNISQRKNKPQPVLNKSFLRGLNELFEKLCQYDSYTEPSFQEIHFLLQHNSPAHKPLDASSAGFEPISTYFQWLGQDPSWMAAILFATKVWNLLSWLAMSMTTSNSCYMIRFNLLVTTAADNANRGLVTYFLGVSLDFPMRNEQGISPLLFATRRCVTAPYQRWEASEKVYSWHNKTSPNSFGWMHRSTPNCCSLGSSSSHALQRMWYAREIRLSQFNPSLHRSRNILFASRMSGGRNPKGSKIEIMTERIPLLFSGLSLTAILKRTSHCTPRASSTGKWSRSRFLTEPALSDTGTNLMTLHVLDNQFVRRKPPFPKRSWSWIAKRTASCSLWTDFNQFST